MSFISNIKLGIALIKALAQGKFSKLKVFIKDEIKKQVLNAEAKGATKKSLVVAATTTFVTTELTPISPILATFVISQLPDLVQDIYDLLKEFVDGLTEKL